MFSSVDCIGDLLIGFSDHMRKFIEAMAMSICQHFFSPLDEGSYFTEKMIVEAVDHIACLLSPFHYVFYFMTE